MLNFFIAGKDLFIDPIFYYFCQSEIVFGVWSRESGIGSPESSGFGTPRLRGRLRSRKLLKLK
jgi:hypothetical protein